MAGARTALLLCTLLSQMLAGFPRRLANHLQEEHSWPLSFFACGSAEDLHLTTVDQSIVLRATGLNNSLHRPPGNPLSTPQLAVGDLISLGARTKETQTEA